MDEKNNVFKKKAIKVPEVLNEPVNYDNPVSFSRGVKVNIKESNILFISGTASIDKNGKTVFRSNFKAQAEHVFKNLTALLRSEHASWIDVVKTTCYLRHMKHYQLFNNIRNQFYKRQGLKFFPASTCIEARLCRSDLLVEIELIAIKQEK